MNTLNDFGVILRCVWCPSDEVYKYLVRFDDGREDWIAEEDLEKATIR